ncbi:MAG TPA: hypothetical protein VG798_08130 [Rhizomicrobium sp.]|nr:hypothetical protein [Rhizomicrobium sp.]
MDSRRFLRIAATIFAVVALAHLIRIIMAWPVQVGAWAIPIWISWIALVGAGVLSFFGFRLAKNVQSA